MSPRLAWQRWLAWLDAKESGEALALFRVGMGLAVLSSLVAVIAADLVDVVWVAKAHGGLVAVGKTPWLVGWLGGATPQVITGLVVTSQVLALALVVGVGGKITPLLLLQCTLALTHVNPHARGAHDSLMSNGLWLLVLADANATWSLDCRLRHGTWTSTRRVSAWPRKLAALQLAIVYAFTGLQKVSAYWMPMGGFSALYFILQQPTWQRFDNAWLAHVYPLTQLATAGVWLWELSWWLLPVWLRMRATVRAATPWWASLRAKVAYLSFGAAMHVGIFLLMEVGSFSWIALAFYPCLFAPAELARLRGTSIQNDHLERSNGTSARG